MEAVLLIGIQASGKSSFFKEHFSDSHVRINLDMLRTRHRENILLQACIDGKAKHVIDNTNVSREERERYIPRLKAAHFRVVGYFLQSRLSDCIERNEAREGDVPENALKRTSQRMEIPSLEEGFDELHFVRMTDTGFVVEPWTDSKASHLTEHLGQ